MQAKLVSFLIMSSMMAPACQAESPRRQVAAPAAEPETRMETQSDDGNRAGPASRFATLDDYLSFLEKGAAIDKAYYRKVGPDRYLLVTTVQPPPPPQYFTREELARRFGFEE